MRWWEHLYIGDNAAKKRPQILSGIRHGDMMPDTYVITLPESGNHILDIRPVNLLSPNERESREFLILGVARGYQDATGLVRRMVDDMYRQTGGFSWTAYMDAIK